MERPAAIDGTRKSTRNRRPPSYLEDYMLNTTGNSEDSDVFIDDQEVLPPRRSSRKRHQSQIQK